MATELNVAPAPLTADGSRRDWCDRGVTTAQAVKPLPWRKFWMLLAVPALVAAAMVVRFGVDTPHYDQWIGESFLFEKMAAGTLGIGDFLVQHNEHRLPVPKLAMIVAGLLTGWNTKAEMLLTFGVLIAAAANYWRILQVTGWKDTPRTHAVFFVIAVCAFSLTQYQNFLWGFQLHFVASIGFFTACCWAAIELRAPRNFIATILLATAATFSIASGFVAWVLAIPLLLLPREEARRQGFGKWWTIYGLSFAANLALYFVGYQKPEKHPALTTVLQRPLDALQYFATYIGGPFGLGTAFEAPAASMWIGLALLAALGLASAELWRLRDESTVVRRALPWLMIAGFGLANAAITTIGRLGFGAAQAMESRYGTYALLVPIGLLPLVCVLADHRRRWSTIAFPSIALAASTLLTLALLSSLKSIEDWRIHQRAYRMEKALVQTVYWIEEPRLLLSNVTPDVAALRRTVQALDRLGYLRPAPWPSASIGEAGEPTDPGSRAFGQVEGRLTSGALHLAGWAVLPDQRRAADAVLITADDAVGMPQLIGLAPVTFDRPDVEKATGTRDYFGCGWAVQWSPAKIPPGLSAIKAWAYDAEERRAFRLEGSVAFPR